MHGYGYPPEQQQPTRRPSSATLVTLRVVFVALALLSCGLLAWAAMLRLAIVTRKARDWWLFGLVIALNIGLIAYLGSLPEEEEVMTDGQAVITLSWMLVVFVGTVTYYLYTEIRHFGPYGGAQAGPRAGSYAGAGPYGGPYGGTRGCPRPAGTRRGRPCPPRPRHPSRPPRPTATRPRPGRAPSPWRRPTRRGPPRPSASTRCAPSSTS